MKNGIDLIFIVILNVDDDIFWECVLYGCGYIYFFLCVGVIGIEIKV